MVLDQNVFTVQTISSGEEAFVILKQEMQSTIGMYEVRYRAWLSEYSQVEVRLEDPFTVEIIDKPVTESDYIVNVMPDWLVSLKDQRIKVGESLLYRLDANLNQFGEVTKVSIQSAVNREVK